MTPFARTCEALILTLVILVLLLTPFAFGGVNQTKALLERTFLSPVLFYSNYFARLGIVLAVMLWLINMIVAREIRFAKTPLDIPIALLLGYTFLWFMFSKNKYVIGGELASIASYAALYYIVVNNVKTKIQMNILVGALIFSGFLIATIGLIQSSGYLLPSSAMKLDYAVNLVRPEQYWGRVGGTFICPNHFAGYLEMIIPFTLAYLLFSSIPGGRKLLIAFCGLVMIVALLLSISRGGWAAFALSAAFLFGLAAKEKKVPIVVWIVPLVAVLAGIVLVFLRSEHVQERFKQSFGKEDSSYLKRLHVSLDTVSLVRDNLIVGTGPGTFELSYRKYRRPSVLLAIRYTHNDYLQTLADYGAIGFAIVISGIVVFARKMWRVTRRLKKRIDKALLYGVLAAVVALLAHSLIDFNMRIPSNAMTMAAIVALGISIRQYRLNLFSEWVALSDQRPNVFTAFVKYGLILVVLLATASFLYLNFTAYASLLTFHQAAEKDPSREFTGQNVEDKNLKNAERLYKTSASLFPSNPSPWAALAEMHLWKADETLSRGDKNRFSFLLLEWPQAMENYRHAVVEIENAKKRNPLDSSYYLTHARACAGIIYVDQRLKKGLPGQYALALDKYPAILHLHGTQKVEDELQKCTRIAEAEFQKAVQMDPNNHQHHAYLASFFYNTGRYNEARTHIEQALEILRDSSTYTDDRKHLQDLQKKTLKKLNETTKAAPALL